MEPNNSDHATGIASHNCLDLGTLQIGLSASGSIHDSNGPYSYLTSASNFYFGIAFLFSLHQGITL